MKNSSLALTLHLLAHPLSWLAAFTLLLNDLLLKPLFPSIMTGKLSDLAGLFLLPFLVGAFLSLAAPMFNFSDRMIRNASLAFPALVFTAAKTIPAFSQFLVQKLAMRIVPDFSDLLTLPVLIASAWLWRSLASRPAPRRAWQSLALPLVLLATLGDMAAPNYGITCLRSQDGALYASSVISQHYISNDGGLTWQNDTSEFFPVCQNGPLQDLPMQFEDPARGILYRIPSGSLVEVSTDGGKTWLQEPLDAGISEAEWQYIRLNSSASSFKVEVIANAALDPATGNLVLAMGHQGVLVRTPSGVYTWVDVGPYRHRALARAGFAGFTALLTLPFLFSLLAAFLAMRVWALKRDHTPWQVILTIIAWVLVILYDLSILPGLIPYQSLATSINGILFAAAMVYLLAVNLAAFARMQTDVRWWARLIPRAFLISLVSFLFFVAWYLNWIRSYSLAITLSLVWNIVAISVQSARIPDKVQM